MARYNHLVSLAFEVENDDEENVTEDQILAALLARIARVLQNEGLLEAVGGGPDHTFEIKEDDGA